MTTTGSGTGGALPFPQGFAWGAATAAYQIEGAASADGRGPSVWDTFSHAPGNIRGGDTGDIACDSYHRYREDVAMMASLGLTAYRFSISWPRIQPGGRGPVNQKGLDYYRALLDELDEHGIAAAVTLFHWDLPQELQDEGGWTVRSTAERFAEYAAIAADALGDRVDRWITLNEPQAVVSHGYRAGDHAPGLRDAAAAAAATHHLLLGHGLAARALRDSLPGGARVGITLDLHPVRVLGDGTDALERARLLSDAELNGLFLEPVLHGRYPGRARAALLPPQALIAPGDLETISSPLDFLGVNYYTPVFLRAGDPDDLRRGEKKARGALPGVVEYRPAGLDRTPMGWLVDPQGLYDVLLELSGQVPGLPLYVTENGCAAEDYVNPDGVVNDVERVSYLHQHLAAAARAIGDGVNLAGYFVWSLLDNFEWAWGYQKRFGIVFVDFGSQRRIPKASARFYSDVIRANAVPPLPAS
jgi:beta-glucosidase